MRARLRALHRNPLLHSGRNEMIQVGLDTGPSTIGTGTACLDETPCLHELFERQCDADPDGTALICGDLSLTYAELDAEANRVAHYLRAHWVGPGSLVGLFYERSELPIIAILGCLKAGAAYVPLDLGHPDERIQYIAAEASIQVVLTEGRLADRCDRLVEAEVIATDLAADAIAACADRRLSPTEIGLTPDDLCYVIFTSGTTGRPKGVMTEHRNATHFIPAFNLVCSTTPQDRIYQGFSLGFDGSVEEIWMAFSNGATLVVGDRTAPSFGNDLAKYLSDLEVTYFSTVPTMLATMTDEIPSLRQVVVSGEACPPQLVADWARPGRLMLNVYGPTEATVNTTAFACEPDRPVTIGKPLAGYEAWILDSSMEPVPPGEKGELYIAGDGIARGYLNQPELTARQFLAAPDNGGRLYRTGDLVRLNDAQEIEFFGRIDGQVKIRGFRVELAEIEAVLREDDAIRESAVKVHTEDGVDFLAAYAVLERSAELDRTRLLSTLRSRLPAYMVPSTLDTVPAVPRLTSGKLDRGALPDPGTPLVDEGGVGEPPANDQEAQIADTWASVFGLPEVGVTQDFFLDLGGHSLLAAQMVARLRARTGIRVAIRDLYAHPTVRRLADHLSRTQQPRRAMPTGTDIVPTRARPKVGWGVAAFQAVFMTILLGLLLLPLAVVAPVLDAMVGVETTLVAGAVFFLILGLLLQPVMLLLSIMAKWAIIGRYRPGAYPLWGSYYIRWWIVQRFVEVSGHGRLAGTPFMSIYYRLMGAKVGRNCVLGTEHCSTFDTIRIGDDTAIGPETHLLGYRVENGYLVIDTVDIGNGCFIGAHSALGLGVCMDDGSRLDDMSLLADGTVLQEGEEVHGSPAEPGEVGVPTDRIRRPSRARLVLFSAAAHLLSWVSIILLGLPALVVAVFLLAAAQQGWFLTGLALAALAGPLLIALTCVWVALIKNLWLRRSTPGVHRVYSLYYLRHWLAYSVLRTSRLILLPVFTTIYLPPFMRLLGAKVGRHAEMAAVWAFVPDTLTLGDGSFLADGAFIGGHRTFAGHFEVRPNSVGRRSFIGNSAMLPVGARVGDDSLIGVLSVPPSRTEPTPDGTDWLGSPAFTLPNRDKVTRFSEESTYLPTRTMYAQRAAIDALRIIIPIYATALLAIGAVAAILSLYRNFGLEIMLLAVPLLALAEATAAVAVVVVLKWVVMRRFDPIVTPLWSRYVWLNEMVNGAYESLMFPFVDLFSGTPYAAPLLRLLGCRIGRHCYIGSALFSEFDLIEIGDHVALNESSVIQTHLFEDRIMKSSSLKVGDGCTVGNMSVVLYDTT
ncbi:MAG: amino acid adenylation domain-containing protein, partial [Propionibacteriaceae bacterium]|nr:amino acid adenylation domain-containing protein [Propionibacteriaceae bacterium]